MLTILLFVALIFAKEPINVDVHYPLDTILNLNNAWYQPLAIHLAGSLQYKEHLLPFLHSNHYDPNRIQMKPMKVFINNEINEFKAKYFDFYLHAGECKTFESYNENVPFHCEFSIEVKHKKDYQYKDLKKAEREAASLYGKQFTVMVKLSDQKTHWESVTKVRGLQLEFYDRNAGNKQRVEESIQDEPKVEETIPKEQNYIPEQEKENPAETCFLCGKKMGSCSFCSGRMEVRDHANAGKGDREKPLIDLLD